MYFEDDRQWEGTAEFLTKELKRRIEQLGLSVEPPALRTVRSWRSKQLLSQPKGQEFRFRQILEGLGTALLLKKGWTLAAIAQVLPSFPDATLEQQILAEADGQDPSWLPQMQTATLPLPTGHASTIDLAEDTVILLAQGILRQYTRILNRDIVRQDDTMPSELYRAMCKLGRLYIESGQSDRAACVHTVLERARYPLNKWELDIFCHADFDSGQVILIDPDLRVPTQDCAVIANSKGTFGEDNIIEHRLYQRLRDATERLGIRRQHKAYTALRSLFGSRSLIGEHQLLEYLRDNDLTPLQGMIVDTFFDSVPDIWLIDGHAHRCAYCGTLMRPYPDQELFSDGRCPIRQCLGHNSSTAKVSEKLDPNQDRLLIAQPQILTYWTGPAIDELAIFDAAIKNGLDAELYPESDLCDVAINGRNIGIDAKSYTSPVSLALRLNRTGIGGLEHYRRRIIAVSDQLIEERPDYLSTFRSAIDKKDKPATLEIMSVSQVIQLLKAIKYEN
ncbi:MULTISPECIES: restriction endonuclease-related protein [unclassified Microcoleus]|uniref:restriction endonuclease-related protein n=1 Tax=unclassified Microcoleus TaxID=2642155 RepID=UPI002FD537D0